MFRGLPLPEIVNLDIPDEYQFMDAELVDNIQTGVEFFIMRFEQESPDSLKVSPS